MFIHGREISGSFILPLINDGAYATDVFFGYDASNAQAVLRQVKAESRKGVSHG